MLLKKKSKQEKVNTNYIEIIEWTDAQADNGWSDSRETELVNCITIGFLIAEDKKGICVANTWAEPESNSRMHIPKPWIKSRRKIYIGTGIENKKESTIALN